MRTTMKRTISIANVPLRAKVRQITAILLLAGCVWPCTANGDITWVRKSSSTGDMPIPNDGDQQTCCLVLDIDKDGIDDFVIGERTAAPSVVWYKYNGRG